VHAEPCRPVARDRLLAMSASLRHRGPDGSGLYLRGNAGLAMRRLAVVDVADGAILFGSEPKALLAAELKVTVDPQAVSDYLSLMYVPGRRSIFAEISKLEAASTLAWRDGTATVQRYWDLAGRPPLGGLSPRDAGEAVRELIDASVAEHLAADVPVGCFLSGGRRLRHGGRRGQAGQAGRHPQDVRRRLRRPLLRRAAGGRRGGPLPGDRRAQR